MDDALKRQKMGKKKVFFDGRRVWIEFFSTIARTMVQCVLATKSVFYGGCNGISIDFTLTRFCSYSSWNMHT